MYIVFDLLVDLVQKWPEDPRLTTRGNELFESASDFENQGRSTGR